MPGEPAEIVVVGDTLDLPQRRLDDPALNLRQLHQVLGVGFKRVTIDLQLRRGHRVEAGLDPGRQGDVADAIPDALALPVILGSVAKQKINLRQCERADRPHAGETRRAVEPPLQRDRDLLLDFFGRKAGHLGGDLDGDGAQKRVGVDRQLRPRINPEDAGQYRDQADDETFPEAKRDELVNH
jgi:hypothetical protein